MYILISTAGDIDKKLISEEDIGPYIVRKELWSMGFDKTTPATEMTSAYAKDGSYIGNEDVAKRLYEKYGIIPQRSTDKHTVSSIGKSETDGKWYGWSHRAIYGFQVGDKIKDGDCGFDPSVGEYTIQTEQDAKVAAMNFAESVSAETTLLIKSRISVSDEEPGYNEKLLIALLKATGCKPTKIKYEAKANVYKCINWSAKVMTKMQHIGWEPQPDLSPTSTGEYHFVHSGDEACVVSPEGGKFSVEFPKL
jgi:hypothetical protein